MNLNNIAFLIALVGILCIGIYIGWHSKKCAVITNTVTIHDTQLVDKIIFPESYYTVPKTKLIYTLPKQEKVTSKDTNKSKVTDYSNVLPIEFNSDDTLEHEGLKVAIHDKGNCYGVFSRKSTFFGTVKEKIITNTVTNTVKEKRNIFQLNAGVGASFINTKIDSASRFRAFDVGPVLTLSYKQKYYATYQYGLNTNIHNFQIQTKIK